MQLFEKSVSDLKMYENNPGRNDTSVDIVADSIKRFGFKVPLVIDKNNEIITGHTRYKACLKLGIETVPCIVADDLSEEQIKAFRLVDNKTSELSAWDWDKLEEELRNIENIDMTVFDFVINNDYIDSFFNEHEEHPAETDYVEEDYSVKVFTKNNKQKDKLISFLKKQGLQFEEIEDV